MRSSEPSIEEIIVSSHQDRERAVNQRHEDGVFNAGLRQEIASSFHTEFIIPDAFPARTSDDQEFVHTRAVVQQGLSLAAIISKQFLEYHKMMEAKVGDRYLPQNKIQLFKPEHYKLPEMLNSPLFKFALDPKLIATVSQYLGYVPILTTANFWLNPNLRAVDENVEAESEQNLSLLFHMDWADSRLCKVFVLCEKVAEENGPIVLMHPDVSSRIRDNSNYRYRVAKNTSEDPGNINGIHVEDRIFNAHKNEGDKPAIKFTGSQGTVCFADTARCFHYGGRNTKVGVQRLMAAYMFLRPGALKLATEHKGVPPFKHLSHLSLSLEQRLLLGEDVEVK